MTKADKIFIDTCEDILKNGTSDADRQVRPHWEDGTPAHTIKKFGVVNRYNLREEFPILTIRRVFMKSALDEILWIYQKKSNNVHDLSSHIWDQWADENGSIGKAYGYQMGVKHPVKGIDIAKAREKFGGDRVLVADLYKCDFEKWLHKGLYDQYALVVRGTEEQPQEMYMDQVDHVLYDLQFNPASRRIITTTWNPEDATEMGLEPCAYSMTFNVTGNTLNAILNQRSQDMLAASGWNVVQYALLLKMMAQASGLEAGELVHVIADCHIYDRHIPIVKELIARKGSQAPKLVADESVTNFYGFTADSFKLEGYEPEKFDQKFEVAI